MEKLRIAIIGCGRIANQHLVGYSRVPDIVDVVAVVDNDRERADSYKEKYNIRKAYYNVEDALNDPEIEAVSLCLPHYLHHPIGVQCMKAGKHVLTEKVMTRNYEDSLDMVKEAEKNNVTLMVGHSRHYYNATKKSIEVAQSGKLGRVIKMITTWQTYVENPLAPWWADEAKCGGMLLMLNGSHVVEYVTSVMGELPETVYARLGHYNPTWAGEDEITLVLGYSDKRTASCNLSFNTKKQNEQRRLTIGTEGAMLLEGENKLSVNDEVIVDEPWDYEAGFALEVTEFAEAIREGRETLTSGRVIAPINAVLDAALESNRTGKVIVLKEMYPDLV